MFRRMRLNPEHTIIWRWLYEQTKAHHLRLFLIIIGNIIYSFVTVVFSLICRAIIDYAVNKNLQEGVRCFIGLVIVILVQMFLYLYLNGTEEVVKSGLGMVLRKNLLRRLLEKKFAAVRQFHCAELVNRMSSDIQVITEGVSGILPKFVNMVTRLFLAIAVLVYLEPGFALVLLFCGLFLIVVTGCFRKKMKDIHRDVQEKQGKAQSFVHEVLDKILVVKVFGSESQMEKKNDNLQMLYYKSQLKRRRISICANAGFGVIFQLGYLGAMCWGALGIFSRSLTYGTLLAMLQLVGQMQVPFANLSGLLPQTYGMLASAERIIELEKLEPEVSNESAVFNEWAVSCTDFIQLCFEQVCFSYGCREVLKNVNLTIKRGDFIAITGLSGGGKSTLLLLMLGIYSASHGNLYVQTKKDRFTVNKETRNLFTYVPQGNDLFSGTIRENITFLRDEVPDKMLWKVLKIACAEEFVQGLPQQLETLIGEDGLGLSEGQAQRISVARALLSEAPILLLDEATSALDFETEASLVENMKELTDKTCLIVTHREAVLKICQRRIALRDGAAFEMVSAWQPVSG